MTSQARARARDEEDSTSSPGATSGPAGEPTGATDAGATDVGESGTATAGTLPGDGGGGADDGARDRGRLSLPLVPTLAVLLALLLGAAAFLWSTRPGESAVRTGDYAEALQAARSGVVDLTSFDYLTLDDDIEQIRRVATGDLREESVAQLDQRRQQITDAQAVVNTEIVDAGVTRADGDDATVLLVIQSTQESTASPRPEIVRYRIEVSLEKADGRWLLSGIKGTETPGSD